MEPIDTIIIYGQQDFELYDQLNPIEIKVDDDKDIDTLKKYKGTTYHFVPIGLLFPLSVENDTTQIFVTCRELK